MCDVTTTGAFTARAFKARCGHVARGTYSAPEGRRTRARVCVAAFLQMVRSGGGLGWCCHCEPDGTDGTTAGVGTCLESREPSRGCTVSLPTKDRGNDLDLYIIKSTRRNRRKAGLHSLATVGQLEPRTQVAPHPPFFGCPHTSPHPPTLARQTQALARHRHPPAWRRPKQKWRSEFASANQVALQSFVETII